jgi:hypothetical protein
MTRAAEVLRQFVTTQSARVENELRIRFSRLTSRGVLPSRAVTPFTPDSGDYPVEMNLTAADSARRMTTKTVGDLIVGEPSTQRLLERRRNAPPGADRKVQTSNLIVEAHKAFIEPAFVPKNIGLAGFTFTKGIENWQ